VSLLPYKLAVSTLDMSFFSTSGMAEDVIVLLEYVGWTEDIHIVGLSLGGMVAQGSFKYHIHLTDDPDTPPFSQN
jgi:hypothetical protein